MTNGRNMLKSLQKCPWEDKWIFSRIINLINKFACIFIRAIEVSPAQFDERDCAITASFTFCLPLPFLWITVARACMFAHISHAASSQRLENWLAVQVHVGSVSVLFKSPLSVLHDSCGWVPPSPPLSLSLGRHVLAWLPPRNSPGLPGCSAFPAVSAGQSLKAVRCDDTDWQLGSGARGYRSSLSRAWIDRRHCDHHTTYTLTLEGASVEGHSYVQMRLVFMHVKPYALASINLYVCLQSTKRPIKCINNEVRFTLLWQ